jgi:amino acid transporter
MPGAEKAGYQFGTFKGVFTPNILTILGVVMYLRFGWVIGNAGLISTLIIVTISTLITFLTALSVSTLATNMKVKTGGAYYIISRALGIEAGASIGLPLYLAQTLGISFYIAGFAESVLQIIPCANINIKLIGIVTLIILTIITLKSTDIALKTQYVILALIALSLISFFTGSGDRVLPLASDILVPDKEKFWTVFAVFFPAVTGIMSGLSMSGDLKKPEKSIPWGTLTAVVCSYAIYMAIPIFFVKFITDHRIFLVDYMIMYKVARWGPFILAGLWGAALSSALASILSAPRTLQAMAKDAIVFRFLGYGFGKNREPRIAVMISFLIALTGILAGDLNVIAPILSMFFLTTYGLLNLSAGFGRLIKSPSWRPSFQLHWGFSFIGAFGCFACMFMINPGATFVALFISLGIYTITKRRGLRAGWGDMKYGILMLLIQFGLYRLSSKKPNIKTWRPNILVLSGSPTARWYLIEIANAISHGYGLMTVAAVLPDRNISYERRENMKQTIRGYLEERRIKAMVKVYPSDDVMSGISELIKGYGFGPVEPNTILIGETADDDNLVKFTELIHMMHENRRNVVIVKENRIHKPNDRSGRIDIWWGQKGDNAGLLLSFAYLLHTSPLWKDSRLILKHIIFSKDSRKDTEEGLRAFVEQSRIQADVEIILADSNEIFSTIQEHSQGASFVFMGLRPPGVDETEEGYGMYLKNIFKNTEDLHCVGYVLCAEDVQFRKIFASI